MTYYTDVSDHVSEYLKNSVVMVMEIISKLFCSLLAYFQVVVPGPQNLVLVIPSIFFLLRSEYNSLFGFRLQGRLLPRYVACN